MAINITIRKMGDELIKRKKKKKREGLISTIGMCLGLIPLIKLFLISNADIVYLVNLSTDVFTWVGVLCLVFGYAYYHVYYHKAKEKYDSLKEELHTILLNNCCCECGWIGSYKCDCKEKFMDEMAKKYKIKLYWK